MKPFERKLLDHGYVRLVEHWGSDEAIIEAARMSVDKGFLGWEARCKKCKRPLGGTSQWVTCPNELCEDAGTEPGDEKLLRTLWENKHSSPFEFAGATFEVAAPIAVFREWHRHRTQSYSEMSARYVPLPDVDYVPSLERLMQVNFQSRNKQATGAAQKELLGSDAVEWVAQLSLLQRHAQLVYENGLKFGVAKELARGAVTVFRYSRMRASTDLLNWCRFLTLRTTLKGPGAQWEIRQYADAVAEALDGVFPRALSLWAEKSPVERALEEAQRELAEWKARALQAEEKLARPGIDPA